MIKLFSLLDALLISALIAISILFVPAVSSKMPLTVVAFRDNRIIAEYPLSRNGEYCLRGVLGEVVFSIHNNNVAITNSLCNKKLCMHGGNICRARQQIVCVPNHILIMLKAIRNQGGVDAISD